LAIYLKQIQIYHVSALIAVFISARTL